MSELRSASDRTPPSTSVESAAARGGAPADPAAAPGGRSAVDPAAVGESIDSPDSSVEVERLQAQLADAERRARSLEVRGIRTAAAAKHGLPEELFEFITAEDEAGANAQAEKLAGRLKSGANRIGASAERETGVSALPRAGGRNPANGGEQAAKRDEQERFADLKSRIPSLSQRILRN